MAEYMALSLILAAAIYLFWTHRLPYELTATLVLLALILPWPHADGEWKAILTYEEAFSGFGSSAVIMITAMFIFGGALVQTGAAEWVGARLFRAAAVKEWLLQLTVLTMTTLCSMFVNDTTTVLVFMPLILTVCRERDISPSRYLLFAAYGSLLGGQWTLIGTRSNILISDFHRQYTGQGLGFFDFTPMAAGIFLASALYLVTVGRRLLPTSAQSVKAGGEEDREYLAEVVVTESSPSVGKRVEELGWSKRSDMSVVEVLRGDQRIPRWFRLEPGDVLIMEGPPQTIRELLKTTDFQLKEEVKIDPKTLQSVNLVTVEALLAPSSRYQGRTLDQVDFNRFYRFTIMGISRYGETIRSRMSEIPLQFGDYLLLLGNVGDLPRLRSNRNLILLGEKSVPAIGRRKAVMTILLLLGIILTAVTGVLSPPVSIPLAAVLAILFGCINLQDAYGNIDWPTIITLGGMIPLGLALEKTGAAADLARLLVSTFDGLPPIFLLGAILLLAVVLTQLIENAAVAIILAPLAYQVAVGSGVDPKPFMVGLAVCVSSAFCTPVAHESTILVLGPGGYRFRHYLQLGSVLALTTWLLGTVLTPMIWPF
jgi:di/tricarboxylate transporter